VAASLHRQRCRERRRWNIGQCLRRWRSPRSAELERDDFNREVEQLGRDAEPRVESPAASPSSFQASSSLSCRAGSFLSPRAGSSLSFVPGSLLSFRASPIVIPSRRRGISPHRCAEIPRPRYARPRDDIGWGYARPRDDIGWGSARTRDDQGRSARTRDDMGGAARGLAMTGGHAPHWVSPPATSIPHRPLSFQASLIVIPSRRRGLSTHRCAEIPRPRSARPRDDRGRSARPRDDRGALRADSGWRRRVMRADSGSQVRCCARLQEDGGLCRAWPVKAAAD
jgi:hypothetical protein